MSNLFGKEYQVDKASKLLIEAICALKAWDLTDQDKSKLNDLLYQLKVQINA